MSTLRTDAIVDLAGNGKPDLSNGVQIGGVAVTSTAAELNILDGVTSTAAEINILDGVTSTAAELNILDGVTSTAAELNILDGVTSTAAELNILDGVTATAAELNLIDGGTARGTTAVADGDGILINDAGTMRMSTVQTVKTYMTDGVGTSTTFGAVGTHTIGRPANSTAYATNATVSNLYSVGIFRDEQNSVNYDGTAGFDHAGSPSAIQMSGTWRALSQAARISARGLVALWVRIS